jgi:hypothetical protein
VAGATAAIVLIPAGTALAVGYGPHGNPDPSAACTQDQQRDQSRLHDGTGARHDRQSANGQHGYQSGAMDGPGAVGVRPLDGSGNHWGR